MKKYSRRERKIAGIAKREGYMEGYQQGLHDGNPFILLGEGVAKVVSAMEDVLTGPAVIEACKEAQEAQKEQNYMTDNIPVPTPAIPEYINEDAKKHFKGKCPYTDKKCEDWRCQDCEVEAAERKYMENDSEE